MENWIARRQPARGGLSQLVVRVRRRFLVAILFALYGLPGNAGADERVQLYRSDHFVLHTDLPPDEARRLLREMESSLNYMTAYWQRPATARVECFVVGDPSRWSHEIFPNRQALAVLEKINGYTESRRVLNGRRRITRSRVYATDEIRVVRHEITHAYQDQVFADTRAPRWYREGMAELMSYHHPRESAVACPTEMSSYLRSSPPRSLESILDDRELLLPMALSVARACDDSSQSTSAAVDIKQLWGSSEEAIFRQTREDYCWAWALCHFMYHHPQYQDRFQLYSRSFLSGEGPTFSELFGSVLPELEFELKHFAATVETGYRVDLCAWNWEMPFEELPVAQRTHCYVDARRGFQPTGVTLQANSLYRFDTRAKWSIADASPPITANGNRDGDGRLVGVIVNGNLMSQELDLGSAGHFVAPQHGDLYVRCHEAWGALADNTGKIALQIVRSD